MMWLDGERIQKILRLNWFGDAEYALDSIDDKQYHRQILSMAPITTSVCRSTLTGQIRRRQ